jgi:NAD(P)-dependent dehydrogenase (short-subunit alcohol dehydrogenase family)
MSNPIQVSGSVALVTGANRGIGAALVHALLEAGAARVYAAMRRPEDATSSDPRVVPIALDITDADQVAWAAAQCGDVQILINNAGVLGAQSLLAARGADAAEREMRVNYFGTLRMCQAFAPVLAHNGGGAIVNVLSILSLVSAPPVGSYAASKAAALSMTQGIRGELAGQGTLVVGVLPGFVDTDMARGIPFPKLSPGAVAATVIDALGAGTEDVYPGEAATIARELSLDPKAVERRFAAMFGASAGA